MIRSRGLQLSCLPGGQRLAGKLRHPLQKSKGTKNMDPETLYVSDLDGTLMRNDGRLSEYTVQTINRLMGQGIAFTFATARSIESARAITGGLKISLPVITRNGAVLADHATGRYLEKAVFTKHEVDLLKEWLPELPMYGFVSCFLGERMVKAALPGKHSCGFQNYLDYYAEDPSLVMTADTDGLFCGKPGYVTLIGDQEEIRPIHERMKAYEGWECVCQKDTYRDEFWLEICPQNSTKAKAILKVKEKSGFQKLVVFGDSLNDLPMFRIADEAYAVKNAVQELKDIATAVIGSNEEDSVACCLEHRFHANTAIDV